MNWRTDCGESLQFSGCPSASLATSAASSSARRCSAGGWMFLLSAMCFQLVSGSVFVEVPAIFARSPITSENGTAGHRRTQSGADRHPCRAHRKCNCRPSRYQFSRSKNLRVGWSHPCPCRHTSLRAKGTPQCRHRKNFAVGGNAAAIADGAPRPAELLRAAAEGHRVNRCRDVPAESQPGVFGFTRTTGRSSCGKGGAIS